MTEILVDTGIMVAFYDEADGYHDAVVEFFRMRFTKHTLAAALGRGQSLWAACQARVLARESS